jgi:crotonobetainyl-CoA:carnitine CoA-transferase CaiB-like acyl-CoA transferase
MTQTADPVEAEPGAQPLSERLPLSGVRVLDVTHQLAGPHAMRLLADLGADVIKVESIQHADTARLMGAILAGEGSDRQYERCANWIWVNHNKRGITLNLRDPRGLQLFKELLKGADVVAENLRPDAWEAFGLGHEVLAQLNPRIIYLKISGYGTTGPWRLHPSFAGPWEQASGFSYITGYPDGPPITRVVWEDSANGMMGAFAVLAALHRRKQTGRGQFIDLAAIESLTCLNAEAILDQQVSGRVWQRVGNRHRFARAAPHGCYRCAGADAWIAIAVTADAQWRELCRVLDAPEWVADPRFATLKDRDAHDAELRAAIEARTATRDRWELMEALQAAGVPASAVAHGLDVIERPAERRLAPIEEVERAEVGRQRYAGPPFRLSRTPLGVRRPAPLLGEHNAEILGDLGVAPEELATLERDGVIGTCALNL